MKEMTATELMISAKAYGIINKVSPLATGLREMLHRVIETLKMWRKRARDRGEMAELLTYSDWELADIGVTRHQIRAEVDKFFWTA